MINSFSIEFISHCSVFLSKCFFFGFPPPPLPGRSVQLSRNLTLIYSACVLTLPDLYCIVPISLYIQYLCCLSSAESPLSLSLSSPSPEPQIIHPSIPSKHKHSTRLGPLVPPIPRSMSCHVSIICTTLHCTTPPGTSIKLHWSDPNPTNKPSSLLAPRFINLCFIICLLFIFMFMFIFTPIRQ